MYSIKDLISFKLKKLHRKVIKTSTEELQKLNLTYGNYMAMCCIYENPGITQVKLSEISQKDKNVVSRIIDNLQEKEYVKREPDKNDRRVYMLYLTEEGKKIIKKYWDTILKEEKKILEKLSEEEQNIFFEILNKLLK
ncbi:MarR family transcriptional regulator [Leptotrichia sp. OH3620_COT-345]|uniref:MarR family winged helix-turn-helix transcriptional regulator n=1 Tax=Leptotrichia sp. OH3620_COT-345 TaxID=2491048 RepID=UPI000F651B72|nr:MarR family transcriptional regulator [Leptotrichia sp. OH3620_COT-345]RRD39140.1 MarR family transcriptional regulator [Leptotrichia sp. OH3620_COT-345]